MTNALAQTTESIELSQILTQNTQTAKAANLNANSSSTSFSNIINGLSAKNQELKTNIQKIDTKTTTEKNSLVSSLNKEALKQNTKKQKTSFNTSINNTGDDKKTISLTREKDSQKVVQNNTDIKNYDSKITNNSSFPKSSPVFSSKSKIDTTKQVSQEINTSTTQEEITSTNTEIEVTQEAEKIIEKVESLYSILSTITQNTEQLEESNTNLQINQNQTDSLDFAIKTIEEVSNFLNDNNSFLSEENKQNILETLSQVKTQLEEFDLNLDTQNFENLTNEFKTELSDKLNNLLEDLSNFEKLPEIKEEVKIAINDIKQEVQKFIEGKTEIKQENFIKLTNEIKDKISKIEEKLNTLTQNEKINNNETLIDYTPIELETTLEAKDINELKNLLNEVSELLKNEENKAVQENTSNTANLSNDKNNDISENINIEIDLETKDTKEAVSADLNKDDTNKEIKTIDLKEITKEVSKIKNILKENIDLNKENFDIKSNNNEIELNSFTNNNTEINTVSNQNIQENDEILSEMVQLLKNNEQPTQEIEIVLDEKAIEEIKNSTTSSQNTTLKETGNTQNTGNSLEQMDAPETSKLNENNNEKTEFDISENNDFEYTNTDDMEFSQQEFSSNKQNENINFNNGTNTTQNNTENQEKEIFTQSIKDKMLMDIDFGETTHSSALSVSDEIAKLAIEETNNLNASSNFKGSVVYESSLGNSTIIKNIPHNIKGNFQATLEKSQNSANSLMNQIGDKLQQLKDNSGQRLTMVLRPNDLGRLSVELTTNQNGLTTNLIAQNEDVRNYIERNINTLRQQLSDAGINVNSIQIKTAGQDNSNTYNGNQNFNQGNFEENNNQNSGFNQNHNNQNSNNSRHSKQEAERFLSSISNFDLQNTKDFSSILNKTLNYNLN